MMKSSSLRKNLILSVALHLLLVGTTLFVSQLTQKPEMKQVSIDVITPEEAAKLMAQTPPKEVLDNQIVEQDENSVNEEAPDKARFLSAKNQTVKKQTVAVNKGDFQNTKNKTSAQSQKASEKSEALKKQASRDLQVKDLFASYDPNEALARQKKQAEEASQKAAQAGTESPQGTGDISRSNDYVKDVDQGLETLLNTREFKYYSYYNRIRRQLAQHWEGRVREKLSKMYKEKRGPANLNEDRITKVIVILNEAGTLVNVKILSDSGLRDLDDAAVEAFRAAAPFPNPPNGIVEADGTVKIRWDFVLES